MTMAEPAALHGGKARRSRVAPDFLSGLKDAVAFSRGKLSLHVRAVYVPRDPVVVRALHQNRET